MAPRYWVAIGIVLAAVALSVVLRQNHVLKLDEIQGGLYYSGLWDLVFMGVAAFLAWQAAETAGADSWGLFGRFILCGACGGVIGAGLGIFFFPLSIQEEAQFGSINRVVGGLLAGAVGVQLVDLWKFLTTDKGAGIPLFKRNFAIAAGLFIAAFGLAGITEYAARFWVENKVTVTAVPNQDGLTKNADGTYTVAVGKSIRFAGAASAPDNVAVHWRLEKADTTAAIDKGLVRVDPETGIVTTMPDQEWTSAQVNPPVSVQLIAASDADPKTATFVTIRVDRQPAAQTPAPGSQNGTKSQPAPGTNAPGTNKEGK
ncbi:MAG TPA: hypothetical protein VIY49_31025 [Bryobacteraceae bacterium]